MVELKEVMSGTICIAGYSYKASKPDELSFQKGDVLTLVSELMEDGEHYQAAASDGTIGLFPSSYILDRPPVTLVPMPWFHGAISRFEAEKLLDRNQDGQFLLRTSQNTKGIYALALSFGGKVSHYLVAMDFRTRKLTINGEKFFETLPVLVEYYSSNKDGIATPLKHPVIRRGGLDFYIDSEILKQKWGLPHSDVELSQSIGQGEFGEVHAGLYRGTQVAVKGIHESKQTSTAVASFLREAAVMTNLRHKNLVQLVALVFQGSALKGIVLEVMGKGSLQKYMISRGRSVISQAELLSFARDVCAAMLYISSRRFVHRDLATRNVLLNSNGQAKISDFGLARRADIYVPHEGGKFPVKWTAPEALKESKFSTKSDVWSFGIFLWEVYAYGRTPYPSIPSGEVLENLEDGYLMDPPDGCPGGIYDIMCHCWEMEPQDRPNFPALQQMLQKSFGESRTPCSSPVPSNSKRLVTAPSAAAVEDLVMGPIATKAYREAPISRKATMLLSGIIFLGPHGSGKTSLMRCFTGQPFRLMEPATQRLSIADGYHELVEHFHWLLSVAGLMYEDELVRLIVEDLLKHMQSLLSSSASLPPPLPLRKRSRSFSDKEGVPMVSDVEEIKATNRLSGSFEVIQSGSPEGKLQLGIRPQPVANKAMSLDRAHSSNSHKKSFLNRLQTRLKVSREKGTSVQRHYSDSVKRVHYTDTGASNGSTSPEYYSPLPERLIDKVKYELKEYSGGVLPPKYFGKLIDTPSSKSFSAIKTLFVTENSICVLVYDASRDMHTPVSPNPNRTSPPGFVDVTQNGWSSPTPSENTYLNQIMAEINNVCLHWSQSNADMTIRGPRILFVGTHSDKVSSTVTSQNFDILRDAIKASPYEKYVALVKFVISSSSIIERSSVDDLKHFVMETVRKASRQQVPLRWLRCIRRFQGLSKQGKQFISLADARKLVSELCDLDQFEEIQTVMHFLHQNHVIMHLHRIHQLKEIVITNPQWFARQMSAMFSAPTMHLVAVPELLSDQLLLKSKGLLTNQFLDYIWRDKDARLKKEELLAVLHKMDLLCCLGSDSRPLSPSASVEDLTQLVSEKKKQPPKVVITSLVVPTLVEEPMPVHLTSLPAYDVEPLFFRIRDGYIPSGLLHRLIVRCIASYPDNFSLYLDAALFEVDATSLLMVTSGKDYIKLSLHRIRTETTDSLITNLASTDLDNLLGEDRMPNLDTCMAVLMFIQAAFSDIIQQWIPHLDYDLCIACKCSSESHKAHYVVLSDVDNLLQRSSLRCETGSQIPILSPLTCWFGETPKRNVSVVDEMDYISDQDITVVTQDLGASWVELGQILGFSRQELERFARVAASVHHRAGNMMLQEWQMLHTHNATFFSLCGALEIIQRRDIADNLIAARMAGEGIAV